MGVRGGHGAGRPVADLAMDPSTSERPSRTKCHWRRQAVAPSLVASAAVLAAGASGGVGDAGAGALPLLSFAPQPPSARRARVAAGSWRALDGKHGQQLIKRRRGCSRRPTALTRHTPPAHLSTVTRAPRSLPPSTARHHRPAQPHGTRPTRTRPSSTTETSTVSACSHSHRRHDYSADAHRPAAATALRHPPRLRRKGRPAAPTRTAEDPWKRKRKTCDVEKLVPTPERWESLSRTRCNLPGIAASPEPPSMCDRGSHGAPT